MIVVDVGAQSWPGLGPRSGEEESIEKLRRRFRPDAIFAFDPHPSFQEGIDRLGETLVIRSQLAAWTEDGFVDFHDCGIASGIGESGTSAASVACFSLASWLRTIPLDGLILKLDCEGSEFPLLWDIYNHALDLQIAKVLVEWHTGTKPRGDFYGHGWQKQRQAPIRCEVEEWQ